MSEASKARKVEACHICGEQVEDISGHLDRNHYGRPAPAETTKDATCEHKEPLLNADCPSCAAKIPDETSSLGGGAVEQAGAAPLETAATKWIKDMLAKDMLAKSDWLAGATAYCTIEHLAKLFAAFAESELSALRRENAELQQSLKDEESASLDAFLKIEKLQSALGRTLANFERILAQKPVRDASETIGEARAALAEPRPEKDKI